MKLKKMTKKELNDLSSTVDSEGFWYSLTDGGYLDVSEILDNEKDIEKVEKAIALIKELEELIPCL